MALEGSERMEHWARLSVEAHTAGIIMDPERSLDHVQGHC